MDFASLAFNHFKIFNLEKKLHERLEINPSPADRSDIYRKEGIQLISLISSAHGAAPAVASTQTSSAAPSSASSSSKPQPSAGIPVDTVHISSAAKAAMQEAIETPAQTAREASAGDQQALRLLAKEQTAK
ncbi:MAG TPA: hypothetical protein VMW15_16080 [Terracidiphilus sp.]|nr:hypothetical protein [Terracidiphilus sp.]